MTARHWMTASLVVHRGADVCAVLAARRWVRDLSDEDTRMMTRGRKR